MYFFFFKQKTAYEMRISDWSSDVCSSDLNREPAVRAATPAMRQWYYARIQASLRDALCGDSETRPGSYRLAVLFWFGASGAVSRYERLSATGAARTRVVEGKRWSVRVDLRGRR